MKSTLIVSLVRLKMNIFLWNILVIQLICIKHCVCREKWYFRIPHELTFVDFKYVYMEPLNKRFVKRKILLQAFWPRSTLSRYLSWTTIVLGTDIWIFMSECVLLKFLDPIFILFVRSPLCELGPWRFKMRSGNFLFFHSKGNSCLKKK